MEENTCYPCEESLTEKIPPCPLPCMSPKCKAYIKVTDPGNVPPFQIPTYTIESGL